MARIRNIKPEFFRHEQLQDLESVNPGSYVMLTYIALWTQADKNGVFPWRPRVMRLDILPFLQYDLEKTLQILLENGYIQTFEILLENGYIQTFENQTVKYGYIPTFRTHQVLTDKEKNAPSKHPAPNLVSAGSDPAQTQRSAGETEIGNRNKEIGNEGVSHAHAHEEIENQKNETHPETPPTPPQPSTGGGDPYDPYHTCIEKINTWAKQNNWQTLRDYAASVGYNPDQYGPVRDEVKKFAAHFLNPSRGDDRARFIADPAQFFQDKGRKWLLDAKIMNKGPKIKDQRPKYEPPPNHQRPKNGNATETIHIGDIAGKIITEIA